MNARWTENVTDIIVSRSHEPDGLQRMLPWSIVAAHIALTCCGAVLGPTDVGTRTPRQMMTISLGGAPGPKTGGSTQMGGGGRADASPAGTGQAGRAPPAARSRRR